MQTILAIIVAICAIALHRDNSRQYKQAKKWFDAYNVQKEATETWRREAIDMGKKAIEYKRQLNLMECKNDDPTEFIRTK